MSLLLDTSGLLSAIDSSQRFHRECAAALLTAEPPLLLCPFVLAELDYLLGTQIGETAQLALLDDVARSAYQLESFDVKDVDAAIRFMRRYPGIGLTDASLVVLAERNSTREILTLDERHFRPMRWSKGRSFHLVPIDSAASGR